MQLHSKMLDWYSILSLFSPKIESELLGILRPLSGLFRPILDKVNHGLIEPDGLDGLTSRGKYHDLLISEWALLEELPDEFERRSAMNEHLFLNKKKVEENQQKLSVVLFDVGPHQFGSPKLGQLAILLLLWRRAAQSGASFRFGALQSNEWLNENQLDRKAVLKLLKSRCVNIPGEHNFNFWNGEIGEFETDKLDLWIVSSSKIDQIAFPSGSIIIQEIPFSKSPVLEFIVDSKGQQINKQRVRLPAPATQIRIIRHPFHEPPNPIEIPHTGGQQFAFTMNGRKSLLLDDIGYLHINVLPKKLGQTVKKTESINLGGQFIALSYSKQGVIRLIKQARAFRLIGLPGQRSFDFGEGQHLTINPRALFDSILYMVQNKQGHSVLFKDSKHKLRKLELTSDSRQLTTIAKSVIKLGRVNSINYYIQHKEKRLIIRTYIEKQQPISKSFPLGIYRHPRVFVHDSGIWHSSSVGCMAYQLTDTFWNIVYSNTLTEIEIEPNYEVFGAYISNIDHSPFLVAVSPDKKSIVLLREDSVTTVLESNEVIIQACMNQANQSFAFRTNGTSWHLYSIEYEQFLLKIG
jgi:hypothetical protein